MLPLLKEGKSMRVKCLSEVVFGGSRLKALVAFRFYSLRLVSCRWRLFLPFVSAVTSEFEYSTFFL